MDCIMVRFGNDDHRFRAPVKGVSAAIRRVLHGYLHFGLACPWTEIFAHRRGRPALDSQC